MCVFLDANVRNIHIYACAMRVRQNIKSKVKVTKPSHILNFTDIFAATCTNDSCQWNRLMVLSYMQSLEYKKEILFLFSFLECIKFYNNNFYFRDFRTVYWFYEKQIPITICTSLKWTIFFHTSIKWIHIDIFFSLLAWCISVKYNWKITKYTDRKKDPKHLHFCTYLILKRF